MFLMQQQVLVVVILLLNQQSEHFFCHGSWITRATTTTNLGMDFVGKDSPAAASLPLKKLILPVSLASSSSSEAIPLFSSSSNIAASPRQQQRPEIVSVVANCTRELMEMQIFLNGDFHGLLHAKDFPMECRARGNASKNVTLRIPTSGCGVRAEPLPDGSLEYSVRVMLQMEQKLRQSIDILQTVRCVLPANDMGMHIPSPVTRSARMRNIKTDNVALASDPTEILTFTSDETAVNHKTSTMPDSSLHNQQQYHNHNDMPQQVETPRVRIWLELGGQNGSGSVEVGVATTLTVRAIVPGNIGVRVIDCAALDGLGESTQQLLDPRGCPIDEQVMPALHTRYKAAEEGWSKQLEEDLIEKIFTTTFPAFKFPDRERLHVSCGVQLCKGKCPNINCSTRKQLNLTSDNNLARIEVFNSLAVTAPQIELDRLRYERRYNMSVVDENGTNIRPLHSEGTLCLSISKLAISFCILGLIFIVAIIVALWSLIKTRRRSSKNFRATSASNSSSCQLQRAEFCTSMFSSSSESAQSTRHGSKLFMPYYPQTFPYGRVY